MKKVIKPYKEQRHLTGNGIQKLYKFSNGWGASVVRFTIGIPGLLRTASNGEEYGSYTRNEDEWELAVIKWDKDDYELDYDNPVADGDVVGYLSGDEVEKLLKRISKFKRVSI